MRLRDLGARFVRYELRVETHEQFVGDPLKWRAGDPTQMVTGPREYRIHVATLAEAQGIVFGCPKCNGGHSVEVTFRDRGAPEGCGSVDEERKPSRWAVSGTGIDDLTTQPSVWLKSSPCGWHGFITNGDAA